MKITNLVWSTLHQSELIVGHYILWDDLIYTFNEINDDDDDDDDTLYCDKNDDGQDVDVT